MNPRIKNLFNPIPFNDGLYIFKDKNIKILYIGDFSKLNEESDLVFADTNLFLTKIIKLKNIDNYLSSFIKGNQ